MMEKVYKVVIIDDEECAIDNLCFELKKYDFISVEGTARNGISGIKLVEKVHPDLIFQDVELPDMLGMDVVSKKYMISYRKTLALYFIQPIINMCLMLSGIMLLISY